MHRDNCPKCKTKISVMKNPTIIDITYYRCTKRKKKCSQKYITKTALEKQYVAMLKDIEITDDFYTFICEELEHLYTTENKTSIAIFNIQKKQITGLKNRIKNLSVMRADNEITSKEFQQIKIQTNEKIKTLERELKNNEFVQINWLHIAKDYLSMAKNASLIIQQSDNFTKNNLLSKLGSNQVLMDQQLHIIKAKPLLAIQKCYSYYLTQKSTFEPEKNPIKQSDLQGLDTTNSNWCTGLNNVRTSTINLQQENFLLAA
jgi:hypothetical protein